MKQTRTSQTFEDLSKEVVKRFLQTAVVLDDGAFLRPLATAPVRVNAPDRMATIPDDEEDDTPFPVGNPKQPDYPLDTQVLTEGFAKHGIICAVLGPAINDDSISVTLSACRRADILVLDWQINGDNGKMAMEIIRYLKGEDEKMGGRMRLIAIYTGERDLGRICKVALDGLSGLAVAPLQGNDQVLIGSYSRISFIHKGPTSERGGIVDESDLPEQLIAEFVEMGKGILTNVALSCIAAIRDATHQILARFRPDLDAPYLTHRILLETPEDAENFAVDLLVSEFSAILQGQEIGAQYANRDAIQAALSDFERQGKQFQLMESEKDSREITHNDLMNLIDSGPEGLAQIPGIRSGKGQQHRLHERLYLLLSEEREEGIALHSEFARLSNRIREPLTVARDYQAQLSLGTVVKRTDTDEYLICIQPLCDALRLSIATPFIFASLSIDDDMFNVVVRDLVSSKDIRLQLDSKASKIQSVEFEPDPEARRVLSSSNSACRAFKSTTQQEFIWICDLRIPIAQRFVHLIASDLSRIGLDEFEWLRRHARGR